MSHLPNIEMLKKDGDIEGLENALRYPNDEVRLQAAQALGELDALSCVESLARSTLEDPNPSVQDAARETLQLLLGNQIELVLKSYQDSQPYLDAWIAESPISSTPQSENERLADEEKGDWGEEELRGLIVLAQGSSDIPLRIRAITALASCNDMRAIDALAGIVRWSKDEPARSTAIKALESIYGEDYQQVLEAYHTSVSGDEADTEQPE